MEVLQEGIGEALGWHDPDENFMVKPGEIKLGI